MFSNITSMNSKCLLSYLCNYCPGITFIYDNTKNVYLAVYRKPSKKCLIPIPVVRIISGFFYYYNLLKTNCENSILYIKHVYFKRRGFTNQYILSNELRFRSNTILYLYLIIPFRRLVFS